MSLLRKASIVTTPTSYENGKILSVKPSIVLGEELVTNGDFATDSNWSKSGGVTISNGKALVTVINGGYQSLGQSLTYISGKSYTLTASVNGTVGKGCTFFDASGNNGGLNTSNGGVIFNGEEQSVKFKFTANSNSNTILISRSGAGDYNFSIDNVSVKEAIDADFDFTRNSSATRVNSQGLIEDITSNLPRIDYTGGEGHWLFEPQSTNLVTYSEDFSQWNASVINVPNLVNEINPSGENQCGFIDVNNSASSVKFTYLVYSTTSNIHTQSVFIKYHSRQWFQLAGGSSSYYANFDVQNGVIGSVGDCTATIEDYGNGWYRCTATTTNTVAPTNYAIVIIDNGTAIRLPNSTGIGSYYVWGAQLEQNSYATSYIPTNGSTVTRLADAAIGAGSSDLINSTEGVLYAEIAALANDLTDRDISLSDGTNNNVVRIRFSRFSNNIGYAILSNGGTTANALVSGQTQTNTNKIAVKYKQDDFALWINGLEVSTDTSGNTPIGLSSLQFTTGNVALPLFGKTKCVAVFKEALTDAELTCLTTI